MAQKSLNWLFCHLLWMFVIFETISDQQQKQHHLCGNQITSDRIVGGNVTEIDEYPWLALLKYRDKTTGNEKWGCGGTLIGRRTILTAAHCVEIETVTSSQKQLLLVRLGEHDVSKEIDCSLQDHLDCADPPRDYLIKSIIVHPLRNAEKRINDVALLILQEDPPYTDFIRPICIPDHTFTSTLRSIFVAGWGSTARNTDALVLSNIKLYARLNHINHTTCLRYGYRYSEEDIICAGGHTGVNACRGDSGGPLMEVTKKPQWFIVGVVQLGPRICGIDNRNTPPTVFARVATYKDWIMAHLE